MRRIMYQLWKCMFSPRLERIYESHAENTYEPSKLEHFADSAVKLFQLVWNLGLYTSPVILCVMYKKGYFGIEYASAASKYSAVIFAAYLVSLCLRSIGRVNNYKYILFLETLEDANSNMNVKVKHNLMKYDFDFAYWPVEFNISDVEGEPKQHRNITVSRRNRATWMPCNILGYLAIHSFGIRLIYPGSLGIVHSFIGSALVEGRGKLIKENRGQRFKLKASDGNEIDSMFVDNRSKPNGKTLVVCCEGNAGFYEIGIMATPIEAGYSALGWNHPGFGGSTGKPFPTSEHNAIDVVMQFAIHKLGFLPENIVLYGWSIGGYTASWAAMNYPDVKGLIIDATFDDVLPLALNQMPTVLEPIVVVAIRNHANLKIVDQVKMFSGPILLYRRTEDEIICTIPGVLSTNRGNDLVIQLLHHRYPNIFNKVQSDLLFDYLSCNSTALQERILRNYNIEDFDIKSVGYRHEDRSLLPSSFGTNLTENERSQCALYLLLKHMKDFKSTHCTILPSRMFTMPWTL